MLRKDSEYKDRQIRIADKQLSLGKQNLSTQWLLAFVSLLGIIVGVYQARSAKISAEAAKSAADTASATLQQMRASEESSDKQYKTQLERVDASLALAAKQSSAMKKMADMAHKSEALAEAQALPYMVPQVMDLAQPIVAGRPTPIRNNFVNQGTTAAFEVKHLSRVDFIIDGTVPPYLFREMTGSNATIAAKGSFDTPMALPAVSQIYIEQIVQGTRKVYVTGQISYSDFLHKSHHTYYCMMLDPPTGQFIGCREQKRSD